MKLGRAAFILALPLVRSEESRRFDNEHCGDPDSRG
jgi:hypothetical protein